MLDIYQDVSVYDIFSRSQWFDFPEATVFEPARPLDVVWDTTRPLGRRVTRSMTGGSVYGDDVRELFHDLIAFIWGEREEHRILGTWDTAAKNLYRDYNARLISIWREIVASSQAFGVVPAFMYDLREYLKGAWTTFVFAREWDILDDRTWAEIRWKRLM